jgi:hypothetical protein
LKQTYADTFSMVSPQASERVEYVDNFVALAAKIIGCFKIRWMTV